MKKNTGFRKLILILFFSVTFVYSSPKINIVSPYINRGVSLQLQMSYNPFSIEYSYKKKASGDQYVAYANDLYLTRRKFIRDAYVTIGHENEKKEISASVMMLPWRLQAQYKANVFEGGKNNLIQNIAISPFAGTSMAYYLRFWLYENENAERSNGYIQVYGGTALGTRKKIIDDFSYIEIFTAPQISFTYYGRLGGGEDLNPVAEIDPNNWGKDTKFGVAKFDFTTPIGIGFKRRYFFIKGGIAITKTLGGEKKNYKSGILTVNSYNFPEIPIFMEFGIHFRKFKQLEREKNISETEI